MLLTGLLLAGCSAGHGVGQAGSKLRVYAADMTGGAKVCTAPQIAPVAGKTTEAKMEMVNDGGWCGVLANQPGPKPFDAGLLTERPVHGSVTIHSVGDATRLDYTPDRRFNGSDHFTVKLLPGMALVHVEVTVRKP
jgi:hypothetical protein